MGPSDLTNCHPLPLKRSATVCHCIVHDANQPTPALWTCDLQSRPEQGLASQLKPADLAHLTILPGSHQPPELSIIQGQLSLVHSQPIKAHLLRARIFRLL
ncbi:unnamed protein product [Blumeria hordei]|uniref:Uncharacterized protein n=1 Tax=Blumeria hordei TaxID=2867405 RepID=A0A383V2Q4_BLUHO|nr:unnamed protein product [Blumeria hordei]